MEKDTKNINIEITYDCWKKLKFMALDKDKKLQNVIKEILEKAVSKKNLTEME